MMFTKHLIIIATALASHVSASCLHGTSLLPRAELPGGKVAVSNFGYTGLKGPLNWAGLEAANSACASSKVQSPINLDDTIGLAKEAPVVKIDNVQSAEFENLGTTVEVLVNGTTTFAGTDFTLRQFHFHSPSEHRIAEEYFPLEMHMVHEAADGSGAIAVISVLFQLSEDGKTTELLTAATEKISEITTPGTVTETGALDFAVLVDHIQTTPLFQYAGSLTTPPCAEGLTFLVTQQPLPLNVATFNAMKSVIKFNSRFTQNTPGESNLLEIGAGTLGCAVKEGDKVEDVLSSTSTAAAEATVTEAPTTTNGMAHPAPVTTTEAALVTEHPMATTTSKVEELEKAPVTSSAVNEHPMATTTSETKEKAPVTSSAVNEHPMATTTSETTEKAPVTSSAVEEVNRSSPHGQHCILGACRPMAVN